MPELEVFSGQWGHKTPQRWPLDLPPGTVTVGLRRDGIIVGLCRVDPDTGLIDAPGIRPACRDADGAYEALLRAAITMARTESVTVESWGDGPERVAACERLGLRTVEYQPGWQLDRGPDAQRPGRPPGPRGSG